VPDVASRPLGVIGVLLSYTLGVVIASRLYQWIGVRVKERGADSSRRWSKPGFRTLTWLRTSNTN